MTRFVSPSQQGQLQGANASINGVTAVIGPVLYGVLFAASIQPSAPLVLPGLAFFLAALLMLGSVALAVRLTTARGGSPIPSAPTPIPDGRGSGTATTIVSEETAEQP